LAKAGELGGFISPPAKAGGNLIEKISFLKSESRSVMSLEV